MRLDWKPLLALIVGLVAATSAFASHLELTLDSEADSLELGTGIPLTLTYSNVGDRPFVLQRPRTFGPTNLNIMAVKDDCTYEIAPTHLTVETKTLDLYQIPLFPEDSLTTRLPLVDSADMFDQMSLGLPGPGTYLLWVQLRVDGLSQDQKLFWHGTATSNKIAITLTRPPEMTIKNNLEALRTCLRDSSCHTDPAENFFYYVHDPRAVPLLSRALRQEPSDFFAARALFRHGASAPILEALRSKNLDNSTRREYQRLLQKLRAEEETCSSILEIVTGDSDTSHWSRDAQLGVAGDLCRLPKPPAGAR